LEIKSTAPTPQARVSSTTVSQLWHTTQHGLPKPKKEIARLRAAFGHRVREIEHIGWPPKAIIDLQAGI
jgi:hypothetical protein